jgi:hypothetical protein
MLLLTLPHFQLGVAAYFISWAFLAGFIMMNIVLAILVDSFTEAQTELKREQVGSSQNGPLNVHWDVPEHSY